MNIPRVLREADDVLFIMGPHPAPTVPPPWQGECPHTCAHTTVAARRLGCRLRCCRCDVVVR